MKTNDLKPGDVFLIQGKVSYCRITKLIEGEELEKRDKELESQGRFPVGSPYVTISLKDPKVVHIDKDHPTKAEQYAEGRIYKRKDGSSAYSINSKSKFVPRVAHINEDKKFDEIKLNKELATDSNVVLICSVYPTKRMNGVGLHTVLILDKEIRAFAGSRDITEQLKRYNIEIIPLEDEDQEEVYEEVESDPKYKAALDSYAEKLNEDIVDNSSIFDEAFKDEDGSTSDEDLTLFGDFDA